MNNQDQQQLIDTITERIEELQSSLLPERLKAGKILLHSDKFLAGNAHLEISKLTRSLLLLNSDQAGRCMQCGNNIPMAQLKAIPTTEFCANCAQRK